MDVFEATERWHDRCAVIACAGELDLATEDVLAAALARVKLGDPHRVVVDLTGVTFMGSSGLRVLAQAHKTFGAEQLRVVAASSSIARLLRMTGLDEVLIVLPTLDGAMSV